MAYTQQKQRTRCPFWRVELPRRDDLGWLLQLDVFASNSSSEQAKSPVYGRLRLYTIFSQLSPRRYHATHLRRSARPHRYPLLVRQEFKQLVCASHERRIDRHNRRVCDSLGNLFSWNGLRERRGRSDRVGSRGARRAGCTDDGQILAVSVEHGATEGTEASSEQRGEFGFREGVESIDGWTRRTAERPVVLDESVSTTTVLD